MKSFILFIFTAGIQIPVIMFVDPQFEIPI